MGKFAQLLQDVLRLCTKYFPIYFSGMKNTVLKKFEPLILFVNAKAIANAITFINTVETTVKSAVNQKECQKLSS